MEKIYDDKDLVETGNRIRCRREELNMTQEELGRIVGISTHSVGRIEAAQTITGIATFYKICDALSVFPLSIFPARFRKLSPTGRETELRYIFHQLSQQNQEFVFKQTTDLVEFLLVSQNDR